MAEEYTDCFNDCYKEDSVSDPSIIDQQAAHAITMKLISLTSFLWNFWLISAALRQASGNKHSFSL